MGPGCGSEEDSASSPTLTSLLQDKEPHSIESKKSAVESGCPVTYKLNDFDGVPLTSPNHDFFFPEMRTAWIGVLAKVPAGQCVCSQGLAVLQGLPLVETFTLFPTRSKAPPSITSNFLGRFCAPIP